MIQSLVQHVFVLVMLPVFLSGCAAGGSRVLLLDVRDVPANSQYMPNEITAMMEDLGYQSIADPDPVKTAERYGEYRMQYRALEDSEYRVDVHMKMVDNNSRFYFYQLGREAPDEAGERRYQELRARIEFQFGVANVRED